MVIMDTAALTMKSYEIPGSIEKGKYRHSHLLKKFSPSTQLVSYLFNQLIT
jgi:hypothetical protein